MRSYYRTVAAFIDRESPREGADEEEPFWRRTAERFRGGAGLDLGCGTGRLTAILSEALRPVVGVDLSPSMIFRARRRLRGPARRRRRGGRPQAERREDGAPHLVVADMRRLALGRRFDLVVAGGDPFAHLQEGDDRDAALAAVTAHLAARGRFLLDALWFPPDDLERALSEQGLVVEHRGEGLLVRERWRCAPDGRCRARYEYRRGGELLDTADFNGRRWSVEEVRERFPRAGLEVTRLIGASGGEPWTEERSRRLVVQAALA